MNPNPQFTGDADPEVADAFYCLLNEALLRAATLTREQIPLAALAALERACLRYAAAVPKHVREMIHKKAATEEADADDR